jgi:hypothetical protein
VFFVCFLFFFVLFDLFIDLLTDKVTPLSRGGAGIAAGLDLGGTGSESASLELIVTRMRFMGAQRTGK